MDKAFNAMLDSLQVTLLISAADLAKLDARVTVLSAQVSQLAKEKTALEIRNTDSGRWKEARVKLADAYLGHRCQHGTDLVLVNTSKQNTLFHMVELVRN